MGRGLAGLVEATWSWWRLKVGGLGVGSSE